MEKSTAIWLYRYQFSVHEHAITTWNDVPGIYIFPSIKHSGLWQPEYVGQADSFKSRFSNHERWDEARKLGVRHVHAMVVLDQTDRNAIERELIKALQPPLNRQLKFNQPPSWFGPGLLNYTGNNAL